MGSWAPEMPPASPRITTSTPMFRSQLTPLITAISQAWMSSQPTLFTRVNRPAVHGCAISVPSRNRIDHPHFGFSGRPGAIPGDRIDRGRGVPAFTFRAGVGYNPTDGHSMRRIAMSNEELETALMSLSVEERASLAHRLIASIDDDPTREIEEAWSRDVDRRAEEVMTGEVELVPGEEVFRKAFARRRRK
ncbi:MAG: hypothetical protein EA351_15040 [Gemmatimonadales bacterium]|nr:MAG: hypothetical protein EA351_15040 [Gemmatimonadales bacterium]